MFDKRNDEYANLLYDTFDDVMREIYVDKLGDAFGQELSPADAEATAIEATLLIAQQKVLDIAND